MQFLTYLNNGDFDALRRRHIAEKFFGRLPRAEDECVVEVEHDLQFAPLARRPYQLGPDYIVSMASSRALHTFRG